MNQKSTLYWSHLKTYEECPQKFLWTKGWGALEVGGGPGEGKPIPVRRSRHHAIMGIVTQYAVERMYNDELWREPATLRDSLLEIVDSEWERETSKERNWIDYRVSGSSKSLRQTCRDGVAGYLRTMKAHKFLGPYAKAEVNLVGWIDKWNAVGGRADTIIRRDDTGITIIDGKNTKHKMRYTDPDQLRWYAMLFKLAYKVMPDRLAYVWFRFPHGAEDEEGELESGVEWIEFTEDDLRGLAQRAVDVKNGMRKEKFAPTPSATVCKFCDFDTVCEARMQQKASRGRKPMKIDALAKGDGFVDLSL